jgi:hypothetical protein
MMTLGWSVKKSSEGNEKEFRNNKRLPCVCWGVELNFVVTIASFRIARDGSCARSPNETDCHIKSNINPSNLLFSFGFEVKRIVYPSVCLDSHKKA